jgi:hypothetical protein
LADAKLEIKAGTISFTGEGSEAWQGEQLDKVLTKLSELRDHSADSGDGTDEDEETDQKQAKTPKGAQVKIAPRAAYLKEKKATTNQARKFLATAAWLQAWRHEPSFHSRSNEKPEYAQPREINQSRSVPHQ